MKKLIKNKMALCVAISMIFITAATTGINAKTPTFNNEEAQTAASEFMTPLTTFLMWAIPGVTSAVLIVTGLSWLTKDEEEREQKPFIKLAKKILIVAIIIEMVPVLLRIFGIS